MDRHLGDMYNRRVIREAWKMTGFSLEEKKLPNRGWLTLVQVRILKLIVKIDFNGNIAYLFILTVR